MARTLSLADRKDIDKQLNTYAELVRAYEDTMEDLMKQDMGRGLQVAAVDMGDRLFNETIMLGYEEPIKQALRKAILTHCAVWNYTTGEEVSYYWHADTETRRENNANENMWPADTRHKYGGVKVEIVDTDADNLSLWKKAATTSTGGLVSWLTGLFRSTDNVTRSKATSKAHWPSRADRLVRVRFGKEEMMVDALFLRKRYMGGKATTDMPAIGIRAGEDCDTLVRINGALRCDPNLKLDNYPFEGSVLEKLTGIRRVGLFTDIDTLRKMLQLIESHNMSVSRETGMEYAAGVEKERRLPDEDLLERVRARKNRKSVQSMRSREEAFDIDSLTLMSTELEGGAMDKSLSLESLMSTEQSMPSLMSTEQSRPSLMSTEQSMPSPMSTEQSMPSLMSTEEAMPSLMSTEEAMPSLMSTEQSAMNSEESFVSGSSVTGLSSTSGSSSSYSESSGSSYSSGSTGSSYSAGSSDASHDVDRMMEEYFN